jgi:hypothetical protein
MKYETRDGKVQKVKVTSANTKISEMITIDGIDIYLRYRLKPFKSHKSAVVEHEQRDRPEVDERHQRAIWREVVHDIHQGCHHKRRMGFQGSPVSITNRMLVPLSTRRNSSTR